MSTELELRFDFQATIDVRAQVEALLDKSRENALAAQRLIERVGGDFAILGYRDRGHNTFFDVATPIPHLMKYFDSCAWDRFFRASGVGRFMSQSARDEWARGIQELKVEPLTPENVKATFKALMERSNEFLVDGIVDVAKRMSWDYKTNTPCVIGPKVLLSSFMSQHGSLHETSSGKLDDLERCLRVIEGKEEPASYWSNTLPYSSPKHEYSGLYFSIKIYGGSRTCHLKFNERGLEWLPQLNQLLATRYPSVLPPTRPEKKKKNDPGKRK